MPAADPMSDGWLESAVMNPDGSYRIGWPSGYDMWSGCLGSAKGWGPWYYYNVVTKHAQEYKTDSWYADCHPGLSAGMCFSPNHAHKSPASLGQITLDFGERVAKKCEQDFGMLGEGVLRPFCTFETHALWCQRVHAEDSEPAIFLTRIRGSRFSAGLALIPGRPVAPLHQAAGNRPRFFRRPHNATCCSMACASIHSTGPLYNDPAGFNAGEKEERDVILCAKASIRILKPPIFATRLSESPAGQDAARLFVRRDRTAG